MAGPAIEKLRVEAEAKLAASLQQHLADTMRQALAENRSALDETMASLRSEQTAAVARALQEGRDETMRQMKARGEKEKKKERESMLKRVYQKKKKGKKKKKTGSNFHCFLFFLRGRLPCRRMPRRSRVWWLSSARQWTLPCGMRMNKPPANTRWVAAPYEKGELLDAALVLLLSLNPLLS